MLFVSVMRRDLCTSLVFMQHALRETFFFLFFVIVFCIASGRSSSVQIPDGENRRVSSFRRLGFCFGRDKTIKPYKRGGDFHHDTYVRWYIYIV